MANDLKATPGPWRFAYDECGKSSEIIGSKRVNLIEPIAKIPHDDMTEEGEVEMLANAHLIAASPVLYDVLNCLACAIVGEANGIPNDLKRQLHRATDALARARGEK